MDPVSTAIITGAATGLAGSVTELVGKQALVDAYEGLKSLLKQKLGADSDVIVAVERLEKNPEATSRKAGVEEDVKAAKADEDPEILAAAEALLEKLQAESGGVEQVKQIATGSYIAQASHGGQASVTVNQPKKKQSP